VVKVRIAGADRKRNRISLSLREFEGDESATLAEDMAANSDKQPQFKTSMELAFERAKPRKL
jgi:predicted RNA-binding protein with RPS1 domain